MTPPRPHRVPQLVISFSLLSVTGSVRGPSITARKNSRSLYRARSILVRRFPPFLLSIIAPLVPTVPRMRAAGTGRAQTTSSVIHRGDFTFKESYGVTSTG